MKNAVILAAGTASRFVPLSETMPNDLMEVRGEILLERQIRQLKEAGVEDIFVVVGYKAPLFGYLARKFGVRLVMNEDYGRYNNISSVIRILDCLDETYLSCSDLYFTDNVFLEEPSASYYALQYAEGETREWCVREDVSGRIREVTVGGSDAWYMAGHVFFDAAFSARFKPLLQEAYQDERARQGYWEDVLIRHLDELPIHGRHYGRDAVREFDTLDDLRAFDGTYLDDTRSPIIRDICAALHCRERELSRFMPVQPSESLCFTFEYDTRTYRYDGWDGSVRPM